VTASRNGEDEEEGGMWSLMQWKGIAAAWGRDQFLMDRGTLNERMVTDVVLEISVINDRRDKGNQQGVTYDHDERRKQKVVSSKEKASQVSSSQA